MTGPGASLWIVEAHEPAAPPNNERPNSLALEKLLLVTAESRAAQSMRVRCRPTAALVLSRWVGFSADVIEGTETAGSMQWTGRLALKAGQSLPDPLHPSPRATVT